jgi:hypothetical protein
MGMIDAALGRRLELGCRGGAGFIPLEAFMAIAPIPLLGDDCFSADSCCCFEDRSTMGGDEEEDDDDDDAVLASG